MNPNNNTNNNKNMCSKDRRGQSHRTMRNNSGQLRNNIPSYALTYYHHPPPAPQQPPPPQFIQPPIAAPMQNMMPVYSNGFAPQMMASSTLYVPPVQQSYQPPMPTQNSTVPHFEQPPINQIVPMPQNYYVPNTTFFSPQLDHSQFVPITQPYFQPVPQDIVCSNPVQTVQPQLPQPQPPAQVQSSAPQQQKLLEPTPQKLEQLQTVDGNIPKADLSNELCDCKVIILKDNPEVMILRDQKIYYQEALFYIRGPEDRIKIIKPPNSEKPENSQAKEEKKKFSDVELAQIIMALTGEEVQLSRVTEVQSNLNVKTVVEETNKKKVVEETFDVQQEDNGELDKKELEKKEEEEADSDKYFDALSDFEKTGSDLGEKEEEKLSEGKMLIEIKQEETSKLEVDGKAEKRNDSDPEEVTGSDLEVNQDGIIETKPSVSSDVAKNEKKKNKRTRKHAKKGSNNKKK